MDIRVEVEGVPAWRAGLRRLLVDLDSATRKTTGDGALLVERAAKLILRTYTHPAGTPTPSPPGSPPALVTGFLARSVETRPARPAGLYAWAAEAGPTAVYARIQELGGVTGRGHRVRLPARPYMRPVHAAVAGRIRDLYVKRWAGVIGR